MSSQTARTSGAGLIAPHGGELIDRTVTGAAAAALREEAQSLPRVHMSEKQTADLDMIASGALSPLTGFMVQADYDRVVSDMHLENGLPWALPVTLSVPERPTADRLALEGHGGELLAVIDVADVFEADRMEEAAKVFRTTDDAHPGVAQVYAEGSVLVGGQVTVFARPESEFPELHVDPAQTRAAFAERGWSRVVGFQTRNPIHRAHEYITEVRARDRRRAAPAPARRQDQGRRRPRRGARATATGCCSRSTTRPIARSCRHSLRPCATPGRARPSGTRSAARTTAARTSSWAATTPAWATTTAPTTRT